MIDLISVGAFTIAGLLATALAVGFISLLVGRVMSSLRALRERDRLSQENQRLEELLARSAVVTARQHADMDSQIKRLEQENIRLKELNTRLLAKPDRHAAHRLHIYQLAERYLAEFAPLLLPTWQEALHRAEAGVHETLEGRRSDLPMVSDTTPHWTQRFLPSFFFRRQLPADAQAGLPPVSGRALPP